jgi:uncharacterized protein (TIGR03435 family)
MCLMLRTSPALILVAITLSAQTFDVASLKPSAPPGSGGGRSRIVGMQGGPGTPDPTRVRFSCMNLKGLVSFAYEASGFQISGPSWTEEDRFDIVATVANGTTKEQFRTMLQNLLAERFKLQIHREQKTISLYLLTVGKNGAKLKTSQADAIADADSEPKPRQRMQKDKDGYPRFAPNVTAAGMISEGGKIHAAMQAYNEPVDRLVKTLSAELRAPVKDDTGLKDKYDYAMTWIPEAPGSIPAENQDLAGPSLMNALQEQLGLKLTAKKGPVEFIVIDHAERPPTEN